MPFVTLIGTKSPAVNREILSKLPALESSCRQSQREAIFLFTLTLVTLGFCRKGRCAAAGGIFRLLG